MPLGSIMGGIIGQGGSQAGGDMAWGASLLGNQQALQANQQNLAEADKARRQLSPWTSSGIGALGKITRMLGLGDLTQEGNDYGQYWLKGNANAQAEEMNAFKTTPGYNFRLSEGVKARDRSAGAKGMVKSGAQQKALEQYGQDIGSEEYNNYFNQLMALSGGGASATGAANSTAAGLTQGGSGALVSGGNMLAQGGVARGSAYGRGANSLASGIGSGMQNALFLGSLYGGGFGGGKAESNLSGFGLGEGPRGPSGRY